MNNRDKNASAQKGKNHWQRLFQYSCVAILTMLFFVLPEHFRFHAALRSKKLDMLRPLPIRKMLKPAETHASKTVSLGEMEFSVPASSVKISDDSFEVEGTTIVAGLLEQSDGTALITEANPLAPSTNFDGLPLLRREVTSLIRTNTLF